MEYKSAASNKSENTSCILNILKNIVISYIITFILFAIFAFVINFTDFPSSVVPGITVAITLMSIIFSGILNGKNATEKGWLTGLISGFLYMLMLYILGSIIYRDLSINSNAILMILAGIIAGVTGGIIGINNKKKYKR